MFNSSIQPGFITLHSNRSEDLAETVISWLQQHPLDPLEEEIILVQNYGMAEWLKIEIARRGGVFGATRIELPGQFLWQTFRQVLGSATVPNNSPLDKVHATWRIMQLLPQLIDAPCFEPIKGFLKDDEPDRMLQLATRLADLFEQYQVYRPDWLESWEVGIDVLIKPNGATESVPESQQWQPKLWRGLLSQLDAHQIDMTGPTLYKRFIARLNNGEPVKEKIARRIVVFGISHIPLPTLEVLAALGQHRQVMLAVPNPCRFYWGDIMTGREHLNAKRRRQQLRNNQELSLLPLEDMYKYANPLLAAWGRQGRDFIRQLDIFDDILVSKSRSDVPRLDLFEESVDSTDTLLKQVQNNIRDLIPLGARLKSELDPADRTIIFNIAHSHVRELEVLQDQLLNYLANVAGDDPLYPRDIVVMVPDIEQMAPAVRAVFGQYERSDSRFIPFDIADLNAKSSSPLISAVDWLLRISQQRCSMTELIAFLEVPAVAAKFGVDSDSLPKLMQWMEGAGIRWGLNEDHRIGLGLSACEDQNSAWFGLHRILLGYASGNFAAKADYFFTLNSQTEIDPYSEVGGLEADLAGSLAHLLQALIEWNLQAQQDATPQVWIQRCRNLLRTMMKPVDDNDRQTLSALDDALNVWQAACEQADFNLLEPLSIVRMAWFELLEEPSLNRRFQAGGVTFCSLMPMRAIPFKVVCLLGMNDGDFPRQGMRNDFDLMGLTALSRPGDRSRRDDDRQLMLEALLSARRKLYISWSGRSVRDNSEQPPSVLVSQLRDYLASGWGRHVVNDLTTEHPLQPFSRKYFEVNSPLITYAKEWRAAHDGESDFGILLTNMSAESAVSKQTKVALSSVLTLNQLTTFLRNPVKAFFRQRLSVIFDEDIQENHDEESFVIDGLETYGLISDQLQAIPKEMSATEIDSHITSSLAQVHRSGRLPMKSLGEIKQQDLHDVLSTMLKAWFLAKKRFVEQADRLSVRFEQDNLVLEDWLDNLRKAGGSTTQEIAWLTLDASNLCDSKAENAKPEKLLSAWVRSIAAAYGGVCAQGIIVGRDATLEIPPMDPVVASQTLKILIELWSEGQSEPLPLPLKTAIAIAADKEAQTIYEGGYQTSGEVSESCLSRMYPDFIELSADGRLFDRAKSTYEPLLEWVKGIKIIPHAESNSQDFELEVGEVA